MRTEVPDQGYLCQWLLPMEMIFFQSFEKSMGGRGLVIRIIWVEIEGYPRFPVSHLHPSHHGKSPTWSLWGPDIGASVQTFCTIGLAHVKAESIPVFVCPHPDHIACFQLHFSWCCCTQAHTVCHGPQVPDRATWLPWRETHKPTGQAPVTRWERLC